MTNKGLQIHTSLYHDTRLRLDVLGLNCNDGAYPQMTLGIFLVHQGARVFARAKPRCFANLRTNLTINNCLKHTTKRKISSSDNIETVSIADSLHREQSEDIFLSKNMSASIADSLHRRHRYAFVIPRSRSRIYDFVAAKPETLWDSASKMFVTIGLQSFVGCYEYSYRGDCSTESSTSSDQHFQRNIEPKAPAAGTELVEKRFYIVFGFGHGSDPWVRIARASKSLDHTIKRGDWDRVAVFADLEGGEYLNIGKSYHKLMQGLCHASLHVKLERGFKGHEPVYSIIIDETI